MARSCATGRSKTCGSRPSPMPGGAGRGLCGLSQGTGPSPPTRPAGAGRDAGCLSGPAIHATPDRGAADRSRRGVRHPRARRGDRANRRGAGRRQGGGLVQRPHGIRPPRPGRAVDPGRSALASDAETAEPQGEIPRKLSPLRAVGAARGRGRLVRSGRRQPLYAAGRHGPGRPAPGDDPRGTGAVRDRQAERGALGHHRR